MKYYCVSFFLILNAFIPTFYLLVLFPLILSAILSIIQTLFQKGNTKERHRNVFCICFPIIHFSLIVE